MWKLGLRVFGVLAVAALCGACTTTKSGSANNAGTSDNSSGNPPTAAAGSSDNPSTSDLTASAKAQITGSGKDNFDVQGVSNVSCTPPSDWKAGATFTCFAYDSSGTGLGEYDGTLLNDDGGSWTWNAQWKPSAAESQKEAAADVTISSCQPDSFDPSLIQITGTIVNHDTQADDYSIQITLLSGSTRVGEGNDYENNVAAGQTSTWSTEGQATNAAGTVTCQLGTVQRTAAG